MAGARRKPNKKGGNYQAYIVDYTGKRVWFVGTSDRRETIDIAKAKEKEHREIRLGYRPPPTASARHRTRPFLEVVREYIKWGRTFGRKDGKGWTEDHAERLDGYLHKWGETLCLGTLADLDGILSRVEAVLRQLAEQGLGGRSLSARAKSLRALCNWCIGHGYLRENPLKNLAGIDETAETERRALTTDEIARLFSVVPGWRRLAYAVAIASGLRLSELRRLDRGDLDAENSRLHLKWKQAKNRKPAHCYLSANLTAALVAFADSGAPRRLYEKAQTRRALPESPLMFIPTHLLRLFNEDLETARIVKENREGRLDFHALRVTGITLAGEAGATMKELQTIGRHADPRLTLNIYSRCRDPRMMELAERVGQVLPGVESAIGVHFESAATVQGARKSLPEQALSLSDREEGLCPHDAGPESFYPANPLRRRPALCRRLHPPGGIPRQAQHIRTVAAAGTAQPPAAVSRKPPSGEHRYRMARCCL